MGEPYRTWEEIQKLYPKEWVFLDQITTRRRSEAVTGGVVLMHSPDQAEFIRRAFEFQHVRHAALLYTGPDDDLDEVTDA